MEAFILFLVVAMIVISLIPTDVETQELHNNNQSLVHCDRHEWIKREVAEVSGAYTVCNKCKYLAGTENQYEQ